MMEEQIKQKMNLIDFQTLYNNLKSAPTEQEKWRALRDMEISEVKYLGYKDMLMRIDKIKELEVDYETRICQCK